MIASAQFDSFKESALYKFVSIAQYMADIEISQCEINHKNFDFWANCAAHETNDRNSKFLVIFYDCSEVYFSIIGGLTKFECLEEPVYPEIQFTYEQLCYEVLNCIEEIAISNNEIEIRDNFNNRNNLFYSEFLSAEKQ